MKVFSFFLLAVSLVAAVPIQTDVPTSTSLAAIEQGGVVTPAPELVALEERSPAKKKNNKGGAFGKSSKAPKPSSASSAAPAASSAAQWKVVGTVTDVTCSSTDKKKLQKADITRALEMVKKLYNNKGITGTYTNGKTYPASFGNRDGTSSVIPNAPPKLSEFPVIPGGDFPSAKQGAYRVVFTRDDKAKTITYQGVIGHTSDNTNGYKQCK